jgi:signal transduction histidine kinase
MSHENAPLNDDDIGAPSSNHEIERSEIDRRIRAYQKQLRRLASELSLAEARERREIASDLHDHIGQALAYVSQKVTTLRGNAVFSGMEDDISEIISILGQTIRYTRDLTVAISPPVLYELDLSAAIDWLAERAFHRYGLKVSSSQSGTPLEVSEAIKVFTFKSVQELITNAAKHARANQVNIHTDWTDNRIVIVVSDDGRGFDMTTLENALSSDCCFGLFSIRERLSYIGGSLDIDSAPGKGARISISTPYKIASGGEID